MIQLQPATLQHGGIRLEPLSDDHVHALAAAAADGRLWELWFTSVPQPEGMASYVTTALKGQQDGHMMPWAVRDLASGAVIGSTRYHDIVPDCDRVEIGYTWYARSRQRTAVNTTCKLLLLGHAFDTVGCQVVGLRTDNFNFRSQRAIEALGAKKGRRDSALGSAAGRHRARHRDVQHPGWRMAGRAAASRVAPRTLRRCQRIIVTPNAGLNPRGPPGALVG